MKTLLGTIALALCCPIFTAAAQDSATPVSDALRANEKRAERNLVAAAVDTPADKYGFKPTPAQMSFGEVLVHLAGGNDFLCSTISGMPAPKRAKVAATEAKQKLVGRLKESFQFCETALAKVDDSGLSAQVPFFGEGKVSRATAMLAATEDWADHYSQLAIYMRLNGLLPPTAKRRAE
jgi:cystathionine beta-lyase/cystathionine gamma-synthase